MAPEQTRGETADRRADLFAVGVMLWEALTGRRMWKGENEVALLHARLLQPVVSPRAVVPSIPEELERIALRALADNPAHRYSTAAEMYGELDSYLRDIRGHVDVREVGAYVSQLFMEEREEIARRIDTQLRELRRTRSGELDAVGLMRIPAPLGGMTPTGRVPSTTPPGASVISNAPFAGKRPKVAYVAGTIAALALVAALAATSILAHRSDESAASPASPVSPASPTATNEKSLAAAPPTAEPPPRTPATAAAAPSSQPAPSHSEGTHAELTRVGSPLPHVLSPHTASPVAHPLDASTPVEPERRRGERPIREIDTSDPYGQP
jgi:serine/threonine-protein kinase